MYTLICMYCMLFVVFIARCYKIPIGFTQGLTWYFKPEESIRPWYAHVKRLPHNTHPSVYVYACICNKNWHSVQNDGKKSANIGLLGKVPEPICFFFPNDFNISPQPPTSSGYFCGPWLGGSGIVLKTKYFLLRFWTFSYSQTCWKIRHCHCHFSHNWLKGALCRMQETCTNDCQNCGFYHVFQPTQWYQSTTS